MTWTQYAVIQIENNTPKDGIILKFPNKDTIWGWTFTPVEGDDQNRQELSLEAIESKVIGPANEKYSYGHTGYSGLAEGCSATVELWAVQYPDPTGKAPSALVASKICSVQYNSPYDVWSEGTTRAYMGDDVRDGVQLEGGHLNYLLIKNQASEWKVTSDNNWQQWAGVLGHANIKVERA